MSAAASILEALKGIDPTTFVTGGMPMLISGPARPANPKRKIFVFTSDFDWTSPPPECSKLKNPCSYMPDRRFFKKGDTIEGNVVTNTLNSEPPSFLESGGMRIGFGGRGKQIIIPFYPMPMLSEKPNYIFTKDFKAYRTNLGATIATEEMIYPKQFKKGDIVIGREAKHLVTGETRILVGKLDVTDAVVPYNEKKSMLQSQKMPSYSHKEAATWALGFSALLVFLKWADII